MTYAIVGLTHDLLFSRKLSEMKIAITTFSLLIVLAACTKGPKKYAEEVLQIKLPSDSKVLLDFESHGGFNGDGETLIIFGLSHSGTMEMQKELARKKWHTLPVSAEFENMAWLIHDSIDLSANSGYYHVIDNQSSNRPDASFPIWERSSYNFTFSLLKQEESKLYFYKLDT